MFTREELVAVLSIQKMPIMPPPPSPKKTEYKKEKHFI